MKYKYLNLLFVLFLFLNLDTTLLSKTKIQHKRAPTTEIITKHEQNVKQKKSFFPTKLPFSSSWKKTKDFGDKSWGQLCKLWGENNKIERKVILRTSDGLERKAILTLHKNAKGNVVLCHPAATNKEFMEAYAEKLFPGYNTIRFDFRWHGENSEKQLTSFGHDEVREVEAAANIFKNIEATQKLPMYGFGISMGAAALVELEGKKHLFDGLILQSCYEKLRNQIQRMFGIYRLPLMHNLIFRKPSISIARKKYKINLKPTNPMFTIGSINIPIFLIHAHNDHFIPVNVSKKLEKAAKKNVKMVWRPRNGKHTTILEAYPKIYPKKVGKFLTCLNKGKYKGCID